MKIFWLSITFVFVISCTSAFAVEPNTSEIVVKDNTITASRLDRAELFLKTALTPIYNNIEVFRQKESQHFTLIRDKTKIKLGINLAQDALEKIKPFLAPPSAPSAIPGENPGESLEIKKIDNPMDYGTLIGTTALASLFSSVWMFYTVLILLLFFLIRTLIKMVL